MKKTSRIIALVVALGCAFSAVTMAAGDGTSHMGRKVKNVKMAKSKITCNAKATEKAWKTATSFKKSEFVWDNAEENGGSGFPKGKASAKKFTVSALKGRKVAYPKTCKVAWDSSYIYIYLYVVDQTQQNIFPYNKYETDSVEYYIDAKDTNQAVTDTNRSAAQYTMARNGKGWTGWGSKNLDHWKLNKKGVKDTKKYYIHEMKIKFGDHAVKKAKAGMKMGFDIQINDSMKGKNRDNNIAWNSLDNAWSNAATMGTIKLVK